MPKLLDHKLQNNDFPVISVARGPGEAKYPNLWAGLWGIFNPMLLAGTQIARNLGTGGGKLTAVSSAGIIPYKFGRAAVHDNTAYWAGGGGKLTGATSVTLAGHFLISVWEALPRFISISDASNNEIHMYSQSIEKKLKFEFYNGTIDVLGESASLITADVFQHFAAVWRRGVAVDFYINGVLDATVADVQTGTFTPNDGFAVGARASSVADTGFTGYTGEALVYQRALTGGEIALLAKGASPLTPLDFKSTAFFGSDGSGALPATRLLLMGAG